MISELEDSYFIKIEKHSLYNVLNSYDTYNMVRSVIVNKLAERLIPEIEKSIIEKIDIEEIENIIRDNLTSSIAEKILSKLKED